MREIVVGMFRFALVALCTGTVIPAAMAQDADTAQEELAAPATEANVTPDPLASSDPVVRGEYLAAAGNCISCHTREGGAPFAGGVAFVTDFGTIYSTNITPHESAGIGGWSEEDFALAMHEGVAPDGTHLYPAFPYPAFTKTTDEDIADIYAYLQSIEPSAQTPPENEMGFPFNQRMLMSFWNTMFFDAGRYTPNPDKSEAWNRGAYLVEGLGHCGACHTPRNFLGAEIADQNLSGGTYQDRVTEREYRPWSAVNLTQATDGLASWSEDDIADYLKTGHSSRAGTFGPMNEVIEFSTSKMTDTDIRAMAVYLKDLAPIERSPAIELSPQELSQGELVYTLHCGSCHLPTGLGDPSIGPPLAGSAVVQAEDPSSLINVILYGASIVTPAPPHAWDNMDPFSAKLDDAEIAALANYMRSAWGNRGGRVAEEDVARQR